MANDKKQKTPFEQALEQAKLGDLKTPKVSVGNKSVDYFTYQLAVHKFNLSIMSSGMLCRGIKLKDLKWYYGLTKKSAKECLVEFLVIFNTYQNSLNPQIN